MNFKIQLLLLEYRLHNFIKIIKIQILKMKKYEFQFLFYIKSLQFPLDNVFTTSAQYHCSPVFTGRFPFRWSRIGCVWKLCRDDRDHKHSGGINARTELGINSL